ncbi:MAG: OsmC family peroxiredoxin, partial [Acidimicrobiia bacterium]
LNGDPVPVGRVGSLHDPARPDPGEVFSDVTVAPAKVASDLIRKVKEADAVEGVPGGANTSLAEDQSRTLHVRGVCTLRDDGVKEIVQNLFQPIGSEFRYLSDEAPQFGGRGIAPDAATYMSAGIGFCFMTQFGRYAKIIKKNLDAYRIVQDIHFSPGGASGRTGRPGSADAVETHVYLDSSEGIEFAETILDMSEQTCFLHAFCRTDLKAKMRISALT